MFRASVSFLLFVFLLAGKGIRSRLTLSVELNGTGILNFLCTLVQATEYRAVAAVVGLDRRRTLAVKKVRMFMSSSPVAQSK